MTEEEKSVYIAWISNEFGGLPENEFIEDIYKIVAQWDKPSSWLLDCIANEGWNQLYEHDALDGYFVMELLKKAFSQYKLKPYQLKLALERFYLCEEYGGFECPDEEINQIYDSYQAPKLVLSDEELLSALGRHFENA